jgi:hypothetical protein
MLEMAELSLKYPITLFPVESAAAPLLRVRLKSVIPLRWPDS